MNAANAADLYQMVGGQRPVGGRMPPRLCYGASYKSLSFLLILFRTRLELRRRVP